MKRSGQLVNGQKTPQPQTRSLCSVVQRAAQGTGPRAGLLAVGGRQVGSHSDGRRRSRSKSWFFFDAATSKELRKIEFSRVPFHFSVSPDGRTVGVTRTPRNDHFWEVASGKQRGHLGQAVAGKPARQCRPEVVEVNVYVGLGASARLAGPSGGDTTRPDVRALR